MRPASLQKTFHVSLSEISDAIVCPPVMRFPFLPFLAMNANDALSPHDPRGSQLQLVALRH
jgi:hypothetical protein